MAPERMINCMKVKFIFCGSLEVAQCFVSSQVALARTRNRKHRDCDCLSDKMSASSGVKGLQRQERQDPYTMR